MKHVSKLLRQKQISIQWDLNSLPNLAMKIESQTTNKILMIRTPGVGGIVEGTLDGVSEGWSIEQKQKRKNRVSKV